MNNKLIVFLLNKELFEIDKYRYEFDNFDLPNIKYEIHDLQEVINKKKIFDKNLTTIMNGKNILIHYLLNTVKTTSLLKIKLYLQI